MRSGKTVRTSSERGFKLAWRTIVAADIVTLLSAVTLYFFAIGSVRGFAFYLGLATVLDLVATYFFLGPAVKLIGRTQHFENNPAMYGLPSGPRVRPDPIAAAEVAT